MSETEQKTGTLENRFDPEEFKSIREEVAKVIQDNFKEDVHYCIIQDKRTLTKKGGEFLRTYFKIAHDVEPNISSVGDKPVIVVKAKLISQNTGNWVGHGLGGSVPSKSSQGSDWAFNKSIKMATKRALLDATISTLGLSEYYTQDLDEEGADLPVGQPQPADNKNDSGPADKFKEVWKKEVASLDSETKGKLDQIIAQLDNCKTKQDVDAVSEVIKQSTLLSNETLKQGLRRAVGARNRAIAQAKKEEPTDV